MKAMRVGVGFFLLAVVLALSGATGVAQQPPGPPTTAAAEVTQCAQAQMMVDQLLATAMQRLDSARQSNAAADLRAAVDSLQNTMRDARAQLAACASTQAAAPMDHSKMPMGAAPASKPADGQKPALAAPMDHSKMPMGTTPATKTAPTKHGKPGASEAPVDHSKMPMGAPPEADSQPVDPVCGLKVNPATAPQATHQGQIHYFCSEQHQQLFQKNPSKYSPKGR